MVACLIFEGLDDVMFLNVNPDGAAPVVLGMQLKVKGVWYAGSGLDLQDLASQPDMQLVVRPGSQRILYSPSDYSLRVACKDWRMARPNGMLSDKQKEVLFKLIKQRITT